MSPQTWNATEYKRHASFVASSAREVIELLDVQEGEKILDIGCGDGALTFEIQKRGGSVTGIDASSSMVASTKKRGIEAYVVDGHNIDYRNEFDAVFSNAALHWLTRPEKVIAGVYRALKPNGRFVAELGGKGNIGSILKAMRETFQENKDFGKFESPWFFPALEEYRSLLEKGGFTVNHMELLPRPTPLESGVEHWLEIFAEGIAGHLSAKQKEKFLLSVKDRLAPILYSQQEGWVADYVRLRFVATRT